MPVLTALVILILVGSASPGQSGALDPLRQARTFTHWFYAGEIGRLWEHLSPGMRHTVGSQEQLRVYWEQTTGQLGRQTTVVDERVIPWVGQSLYVRTAAFQRYPLYINLEWIFDGQGLISSLNLRRTPPALPSRYLSYQTKTRLRLPFDGEWLVFWGGRSVAENSHVIYADRRFGYDLVYVRRGSLPTRDPALGEHYDCQGRTVRAPAGGTIVGVVDGIPDNPPGAFNTDSVAGNSVVIDHGNGEFSMLWHLQRGSIPVKLGEVVRTGDVIGRCGNSGNSAEPHLHYHLQNSRVMLQGEGLPAQFLEYYTGDQLVPRGEPTRGQQIKSR